MGRLVQLLKDVIVDSTQNRNQGRRAEFDSPNTDGPFRQNEQDSYNRADDQYRGENRRDFDDEEPRLAHTGGNYGRRQQGEGNAALSPPPYVPQFGGRTSPADRRDLEYGSTQGPPRLQGRTTQVPDMFPREKRSSSPQSYTNLPQPRGGDDAAHLSQTGGNHYYPVAEGAASVQDRSYIDDRSGGPNQSPRGVGPRTLRGPEALTLRGSPPQRQYEPEPPNDQAAGSDPRHWSRRDRRRARRSDRRAGISTGRGGVISLLKDSIVSAAGSRSSGERR